MLYLKLRFVTLVKTRLYINPVLDELIVPNIMGVIPRLKGIEKETVLFDDPPATVPNLTSLIAGLRPICNFQIVQHPLPLLTELFVALPIMVSHFAPVPILINPPLPVVAVVLPIFSIPVVKLDKKIKSSSCNISK